MCLAVKHSSFAFDVNGSNNVTCVHFIKSGPLSKKFGHAWSRTRKNAWQRECVRRPVGFQHGQTLIALLPEEIT